MEEIKVNEKSDVLEWFYNFRPDMSANELFIENLYDDFLELGENLSLDERSSFYAYVVSNYRSKTIDFIYSTLEDNWNEIFENWEEQGKVSFHVKNLMKLIDSEDPLENQEKYPHLDFNDDNINEVYLKLIEGYVLKEMIK